MISYDKKFIFVHINKTAGTSMEKALADYGVKKLEEKNDLKFELNYNQSQHFNCDEYKKYLGFFWQPHRIEMKNHQNGKSSVLKFAEVSFKKGLTDKDFSQNSLKRSR